MHNYFYHLKLPHKTGNLSLQSHSTVSNFVKKFFKQLKINLTKPKGDNTNETRKTFHRNRSFNFFNIGIFILTGYDAAETS